MQKKSFTAEELLESLREQFAKSRHPVPVTDEQSAELSEQFRRDPTLETYVRLRRTYPKTLFSSVQFGGLNPILAIEPQLASAGIELELMMGVLDADEGAINELSLRLLENLRDRRSRAAGEGADKQSPSKKGDALIDYLIAVMVESIAYNAELEIPFDLRMLIKQRVGAAKSDLQKASQTAENKGRAVVIGAQMILRGEKPTLEAVAKFLNVDKKTVSGYFINEGGTTAFRAAAKAYAELLRDVPDTNWEEVGLCRPRPANF